MFFKETTGLAKHAEHVAQKEVLYIWNHTTF